MRWPHRHYRKELHPGRSRWPRVAVVPCLGIGNGAGVPRNGGACQPHHLCERVVVYYGRWRPKGVM